MTITLLIHEANRSDMVDAPVCAPSFMVALAGEFYNFTKDMTVVGGVVSKTLTKIKANGDGKQAAIRNIKTAKAKRDNHKAQ